MHTPEITALLQQQAGIITFAQAKDAGMTRGQVRHRERRGEWVRLRQGVYRHAVFPRSLLSDVWFGVLATGGVASHRTAGFLHGFQLGRQPKVAEIVVEHGRWSSVDGVTVHQSTQIDRIDKVAEGGVPCTGPGRTILDLGVSMNPRTLGRTVDGLLAKKRTTQAELWDVLIRHSVQGRNGCGPLRIVLEVRRGQERIALSQWSYMVANLLESAGLERPRLEFRAHARDGRFLAQIDLAYPKAMLAIELDSLEFHGDVESFGKDRSRARQLTVEGWSVLQFTWQDYTKRPDQLIAQVKGILNRPMAA